MLFEAYRGYEVTLMGQKKVRQLKRKYILMIELKDYTFFRFLAETKIRRKD